MSNEVFLFQILYSHLEYLFFSLMKVRKKIYPMWATFYQWPKIPLLSIGFNVVYVLI
jgi:hypothetical protein